MLPVATSGRVFISVIFNSWHRFMPVWMLSYHSWQQFKHGRPTFPDSMNLSLDMILDNFWNNSRSVSAADWGIKERRRKKEKERERESSNDIVTCWPPPTPHPPAKKKKKRKKSKSVCSTSDLSQCQPTPSLSGYFPAPFLLEPGGCHKRHQMGSAVLGHFGLIVLVCTGSVNHNTMVCWSWFALAGLVNHIMLRPASLGLHWLGEPQYFGLSVGLGLGLHWPAWLTTPSSDQSISLSVPRLGGVVVPGGWGCIASHPAPSTMAPLVVLWL